MLSEIICAPTYFSQLSCSLASRNNKSTVLGFMNETFFNVPTMDLFHSRKDVTKHNRRKTIEECDFTRKTALIDVQMTPFTRKPPK